VKATAIMKALNLDPKLDRGAWHAEARKGTEQQAIEYCGKNDSREPGATAIILGERTKQGKRSDLEQAANVLLETNGNLKRVAEEYPSTFIRYHRGMEAYWTVMFDKQRMLNTDCRVLGRKGCHPRRVRRTMAHHVPATDAG